MPSPPPQAEQLARARRRAEWRPTRRGVLNTLVFLGAGSAAHWALGTALGPAHPRLADWGATLAGGAALLGLEVLRLLWHATATPDVPTARPTRAPAPAASASAATSHSPHDPEAAS